MHRCLIARYFVFALSAACLLVQVGCGAFRAPQLPRIIQTPEAMVERVELVEATDEAATYHIIVTLENPNDDIALPMPISSYSLTVAGQSYRTDVVPEATVPGGRSITVVLPAVIAGPAEPAARFETRGWVTVNPPGQVRQIFYDIGWPRPSAAFFAQGVITPPGE